MTVYAEAHLHPQSAIIRLTRPLLRASIRAIFHLLSRVRIEGRENVPSSGGYLVIANHVSLLDPALGLCFFPVPLEAAGAVDALEHPIKRQLFRFYGVMKVHRGTADRILLKAMIEHLENGRPVFIMPEGTRSHRPGMQHAQPGAAYVAGKAQVPIVPVGLSGVEQVRQVLSLGRRPVLRMTIGKPFTLPPVPWHSPERRAVLADNTVRMMQAIAELLPPEYHGVYSSN